MTFRFYIPQDQFVPGEVLFLSGEEFHHAKNVLRMRIGEQIALINGRGSFSLGTIASISKEQMGVEIFSVKTENSPKKSLTLVLPFLRVNHMDFAIEKATELGIDRFILFKADNSEKKEISETYFSRLKHLCLSATKQSGRVFLPQIIVASSLQSAVEVLEGKSFFWCHLDDSSVFIQQRLQSFLLSSCAGIVGPESGWSIQEKEYLSSFASPVFLSPTVLRAETAAIVVAFALNSWRITC